MNEVVTLQFSLRISLVQQYIVLRFCKESDQEMINNAVSLAELANTKTFLSSTSSLQNIRDRVSTING